MINKYRIQANESIRAQLKEMNTPIWMLAQTLGVSEATVVRWLRIELSETERAKIEDALDQLRKAASE